MEFNKSIEIELKTGQVIQLQMSEAFFSKVRESLMIPPDQQVTERHIKTFLVNSMQRALEG